MFYGGFVIYLTLKAPNNMKKRFIYLIIIALISVSDHLSGQILPIGETFSSDTIFQPFSGNQPVYSIHLYGSIQLYSDSSLVRVVLVDTYGNHLLIFESYPLITDTNSFTISGGCDETCFLDGIVPDSIRVDIISAFCTLDSLKIDTNYIPNAIQLQGQTKWNSDSVKISVMNSRIKEEHMYWRAGRTTIGCLSFSYKEQLFGDNPNLEGYDFFKGGIFRKNSDKSTIYENSTMVEEFDWRYRHGATIEGSPYFNSGGPGWFTSIKDQVVDTMINYQYYYIPAQTCYVFSPIAAVEARLNLVYNMHPNYPNLNISEMDVWRCPQGSGLPWNQGDSQWKSFNKLMDANYKVQEDCFPYTYHNVNNNAPCSWKCTDPDQKLCYIESKLKYFGNHNEDEVKKFLIEKGPYSVRIKNFPSNNVNHYMVLSGYSSVKEGDTVYKGGQNDPAIVIEPGSSIINTGYWNFKNSWGGDQFQNIQNTPLFWANFDYTDMYVPTGLIYWYGHNTSEMKCTDEDGDGYYWWGVNLSPQSCNCPASVKEEQRDCNDNDITAGPYATSEYNPYGQFFYSCIPNNCETSNVPYVVNSDGEQWTVGEGDRHMDSTIIIPSGAELTINCQVFFTPDAKIIIKPGGTLKLTGTIMNPARLTSGCAEFWGGIELQGDAGSSQDTMNQGRIIIKYGIIENAKCGIKTINAGTVPDGGGVLVEEGTPSGGIIQATGAIFRNNITGAKFLPYTYTGSNISYFKGCTFETTDTLLEQKQPRHHLEITGIPGLKIQGCTFRNVVDPSMMPMSIRGTGIYIYNSKVILDTLQKLDTITVNLLCNFDSLNYGIYAFTSSLGSSSLFVHLTRFKDNGRGIYASGFTKNNTFEIHRSEFEYLHGLTEDSVYMLYLNNCTGFKVHQNSFSGTTNVNHDQYGVIVNNSGTDNNFIYDNTFLRLTYGLQGLNINHNTDAAIGKGVPVFIPTGLRFICNRFIDVGCNTDFLINEIMENPPFQPGIAYNQRNASNITNPTQEPAGNLFTQNHGDTTDNRYDIDISTTVGKILYTHHTYSYPQTNLRLKPDDVSNKDWVGYKKYSDFPYVDSVSCRDDFFPEESRTELRLALSQANYKVDSLITLLRILVDDGSTDTLKSAVDNSQPPQSYDIYLDLLNASPYLSDSVVTSSIEKEDVLPNAMIRDIMVANPQSAKSEDLLNALDQREEPLPDSMWVEILQGKDTVGAMERLVDELSGWIQRRDLYFQALAELFSNDTSNLWTSDSLMAFYLSDTWLSSRYLLVNYYLGIFDYPSANNVLHNIPYDFDLTEQQFETYSKMIDLVSILPQLYNDSSGYIVPDSSQSMILEDLATLDYDIPGAWARNILIASGLMAYDEPIFSGSTLKSSRKDGFHWTRSHSIESDFKVFPNPAKDFIIVEYKNNCNDTEGLIRILDLDGRLLKSQPFKKSENQQIIPVMDLTSGTYIVQFNSHGSCKGSQKVIIIR